MYILDLETDGLMDTVTKVHCAVLYDTGTGEIIKFGPEDYSYPVESIIQGSGNVYNIRHLPGWLNRYCLELSCHNGIGFDLKVLKKLYNYEYKGKYFDTLLASRILWPDIEGGHSVDVWGKRFGIEKPKHEDWSVFSEEMLHRCVEDTKIQARLYEHIQDHIVEVNKKDSRVDFDKVFRLEHKVWEIMEQQHDYGWKIDLEHAFQTKDSIEKAYNGLEEQLIESLPIRVIRPNTGVTKAHKADGGITSIAARWVDGNLFNNNIMGDFCKVEFKRTNPGSPDQIKEYLISQGWQPLNWNYQKDRYKKIIKDKNNKPIKTSPKLPKGEEWDIVEELTDNPKIKLVAQFYVLRHRRGLINSFIENCDNVTHRIYYDVITCGTNTARMQHKIVVNVPRVE